MALNFRSRFPAGNGVLLQLTATAEGAEVHFTPEPKSGPEALWFYFTLTETAPAEGPAERKLKLVLRHFRNLLGGNNPGALRPVLKAGDQDWVRLRAGKTELEPDGQISVSWELDYPAPEIEVALCFPYGKNELSQFLQKTRGYWQVDPIGLTGDSKPLTRWSNHPGTSGATGPGLYLLARQHCGEVPGSWVLEGLLAELARLKRPSPLVWCVPVVDPDGLHHGEYGKDRFPCDFNRSWGKPPMRPEVLAIQHDVARWRERCRPGLALDFHAPGACEAEGIYAYLPREGEAAVQAESEKWANVLGEALSGSYGAPNFKRVAQYPSRWETPTATTFFASQGVPALTLETPYSMMGEKLLSRKCYREAGQILANAIVHRLR